jgi:hypothetical protein
MHVNTMLAWTILFWGNRLTRAVAGHVGRGRVCCYSGPGAIAVGARADRLALDLRHCCRGLRGRQLRPSFFASVTVLPVLRPGDVAQCLGCDSHSHVACIPEHQLLNDVAGAEGLNGQADGTHGVQ